MITYDPLMLCDDLNWLIAEIERLKKEASSNLGMWELKEAESTLFQHDAEKAETEIEQLGKHIKVIKTKWLSWLKRAEEAERKLKAREAKIHDLLEFQEGLERMIAAYKDQVKADAIAQKE